MSISRHTDIFKESGTQSEKQMTNPKIVEVMTDDYSERCDNLNGYGHPMCMLTSPCLATIIYQPKPEDKPLNDKLLDEYTTPADTSFNKAKADISDTSYALIEKLGKLKNRYPKKTQNINETYSSKTHEEIEDLILRLEILSRIMD